MTTYPSIRTAAASAVILTLGPAVVGVIGPPAQAAPAAVQTWVVQGTVTGEDAPQGISGAVVELGDDGCRPVAAGDCFRATVTTDAQGHYVFPAVPLETGNDVTDYTVRASAAGSSGSSGYAVLEKIVPHAQDAVLDFGLLHEITCRVTVTGDARPGGLLHATTTVTPASATVIGLYQWIRAGQAADGSDGVLLQDGIVASDYRPTTADVGHTVFAFVNLASTVGRGSADCVLVSGAVVAAGNPATVPAASAVPVSGSPALTGRGQVGKVLRASPGIVPSGTAVAYQWFRITRAGRAHRSVVTPIRGATGMTYRARAKDRRAKVFARMVLTHAGYTSRTVSTRPVRIR